MNCKEAIPLIHEYLDGDLKGSALAQLNEHLLGCGGCRSRLRQLEQAGAMIRTLPTMRAPDDLTDRIMAALPRQPRRLAWMKWIRRHPAASVAVVFLIVMMSSFMMMWNDQTDLVVQGADLDQVVIEGDTVTVPAGHTVNGNLVVENGKLRVDGEVKGNLVVINGNLYMASTAVISGRHTEIDQALDWMWYKVSQFFGSLGD